MKNKYTPKQKDKVIERYRCGDKGSEIAKQTGIPKTTVYGWIRAFEADKPKHDKKIDFKMYYELETKYLRQKKIIEVLHNSPCIVNAPLDEKIETIDKMFSEKYTVNLLCEALCVPKGTYYNRKLRGKNGDTEAKQKRDAITPIIKEIYDESNQIYGPSKVHAIIKERGYTCSIRVVESIMHTNNWFSIRTGAKALYEMNCKRRENLVKQKFIVSAPNQVWVSDVTEVKYKEKRLFLCVIIDLYARKVIAYKYSNKNNTSLTKKTFETAYISRNPGTDLIFHSDQGSNFVSKTFRMCLATKGIKQSYSRSGVPYDNSVCESFFSIYKQEEFYRKDYGSEAAVKRGINNFMLFYNSKRPHSLLRYRNPNAYEEEYYNRIKHIKEKIKET